MNHPEWYHRANDVQRYDAECIMAEYAPKLQWLPQGGDSLIDLGSGSGDVFFDFIYPQMPENFQRMVCSDISAKMVNFARNQYGHFKGVEFKVFDMGSERGVPLNMKGQFDHVTSFYAMMYPRSLRQTFRNIYDFLKPQGGDCLLVTVTYHPTFEAYRRLSQIEKWSQYMIDVESFMPQQMFSPDPKRDFIDFLQEAGFTDYQVDIRNKIFPYKSLNVFRNNMVAVNPFIDRIPTDLQSDFINDFLSCVCEILGLNIEEVDFNDTFPIPYALAVIYAKKSNNIC